MNLSKLNTIATKGDRIVYQTIRILWVLFVIFLVRFLFIKPADEDKDRATVGKILGALFVSIMILTNNPLYSIY
jgi:hypothetical protein